MNAKASLNSLTYKPNDREEMCERMADKNGKTSNRSWFFEVISCELDFERVTSLESFSPCQIYTIRNETHRETQLRVFQLVLPLFSPQL